MLFMSTACGAYSESGFPEERLEGASRKTPIESIREPYKNSEFYKEHMPFGTTEEFYDCMDALGDTNGEKSECIDDENTRQDKRLNGLYRVLISAINDEAKRKELVAAQKKWLQSRESDADFEKAIYDKERIGELQLALNDMIRITQRADWMLKLSGPIGNEDAALDHNFVEDGKAVTSSVVDFKKNTLSKHPDHDEPSFPIEVQGAWELGPRKCRAPLSVDSTSGINIGSKSISGYEHMVRILRGKKLSDNPVAWKIDAMDDYNGEQTEIKELFIVSADSLTITDGSYSKTYRRCPERKLSE